jgi:trk/ktr system potassium uptake protein
MKAVIVGCGRVGAGIADELDRAGWQVVIIDLSQSAFNRLPASFGGLARRGDGTDEDTLRLAGAEGADLFLALTEGDNRNVMAAQIGFESLGARRCVAKINDPVRAEAYAHLGIASLCRTNLMMTSVLEYVGQVAPARPGIYAPSQVHPHATNGTSAEATSADGAADEMAPGASRDPEAAGGSANPVPTSRPAGTSPGPGEGPGGNRVAPEA